MKMYLYLSTYLLLVVLGNDASPIVEQCKNALTNETYKDGEKWMEGVCSHCVCDQGKRYCALESCRNDCDPKYLIYKDDRCCPICVPPPPKQCYDEVTNRTYKHKAMWKPDTCTTCSCERGEITCATQDCAPVMCKNPITKPGECCAKCVVQECYDPETRKSYKEMDSWVLGDGCTKCFCMGGTPMCMSPMCALDRCNEGVEHINVQGLCCPVCADKAICDAGNGNKIVEGRQWQNDDCQVCQCTSQGTICEDPVTDRNSCNRRLVKMSQKCPKVCLSGKNYYVIYFPLSYL